MATSPRFTLLRRHVIPFSMGFGVLTAWMLMSLMRKQVPRLYQLGVPSARMVEVFVLSIPFVVSMMLPMAVLIAVLYVFLRVGGKGDPIQAPASRRGVAILARPVVLLRCASPR